MSEKRDLLAGIRAAADIRFQAEHIAIQKLHNTGCNCVATQVLVLSREWDLADDLLVAVKTAMASQPSRRPYYPGMEDRQARAVEWHPEAELLDTAEVPKTMICGLDPETDDEPCFSEEFFGATSTPSIPARGGRQDQGEIVHGCR